MRYIVCQPGVIAEPYEKRNRSKQTQNKKKAEKTGFKFIHC